MTRTACARLCLGILWAAASAHAAESWVGLVLEDAFARLESQGLAIVYSSDLVKPWLRVRAEPGATAPREVLEEILAPHGLGVEPAPDGALVIVRAVAGDRGPAQLPAGTADAAPAVAAMASAPLSEIVVSTSRYDWRRDAGPSVRDIGAADLAVSPDLGDDPLRAVARLPGTAAGDYTAQTNLRGGQVDETLVRFDGLRLYNPFHLKDFQGMFSSIDPRIVDSMRLYAGGFPASYGDRMSGVLEVAPVPAGKQAYREVALSFFNASAMGVGTANDGDTDWVAAYRRGNLDLILEVVDPDWGNPRYQDFYARLGHRFSEALHVSGNLLLFDDDIDVSEPDGEEVAQATYRDEYYWLRFDLQPTDKLSGELLASHSRFKSEREGLADQSGVSSGRLREHRDVQLDALQTSWTWRPRDGWSWQAGGEWRRGRADYRYQERVVFDLLIDAPGAWDQLTRTRRLEASPEGSQYALFGSARVALSDRLTAEAGLRWDDETLSAETGGHVSPRLSLRYELGQRTAVRAAWGRFVQSQTIDELQIADGIDEFLPAQHAEHWVTSLEHRARNGLEVRLEAYWKDYDRLRPRYENLLNSAILLPELKPDRIRIEPDSARAKGVELTVRGLAGAQWDWWLSYTWSSVRDETNGSETRRNWDQTHLVNGGLVWRASPWTWSLLGRYHTGWPRTALTLVTPGPPVAVAEAGPVNGERLRSYWSLDTRIARDFSLGEAGSLNVYLEVTNLLNRNNQCCIDYGAEAEDDEPPLQIDVIDYLPIFPTLGFTWRF